MIKINLAKVKREKTQKGISFDISSLKTLKVQELFKAGGEYYAGVFLWLGVVAVLGYYWKLKTERDNLKNQLDTLNAQKVQLQAQAGRFRDEKKQIEETIANLNKQIQKVEKSKDIIVGLKAYYETFNAGFYLYTSQTPKTSWLTSYRQLLDINQQKLTSEFEISSLDYFSLSSYGKAIESLSQRASFTQLERKLNPHGFEYYTVKLSAEKNLQEVR